MAAEEILTKTSINPVLQRHVYVRGWLETRCRELTQELNRGEVKPFSEVVVHFGDPHAFGQQPITFLRQLLSCLLCPHYLEDPSFPQDVKYKARRILQQTPGFAIGSYTDPIGMKIIREDVANYISQRDGYPADPDCIILTQGGAQGIELGLQAMKTSCEEGKGRAGVMIPYPLFPHYRARCLENNHYKIPCYLDEDNDWALDIKELKRAVDEARPHCLPRALVLINPGNPTGQVLTYDNIREVIKFCAREKLILFADEVYQETIFTEHAQFHSCKKVLRDLGPEYNHFQLMSINSASKGFYGECSLRGAYIEFVGFSDEVRKMFRSKLSANCNPAIIGQAAVEAICNPPQPGDESYDTFIKEKMAILNSYQRKAKMTTSILNSLEGVTCTKIEGAMYAFPRVIFPRKAIQAAKLKNVDPDEFYCWEFLEASGIYVVPGNHFDQKEGTYHFRVTILPREEKFTLTLEKIKKFHEDFMDRYRDE